MDKPKHVVQVAMERIPFVLESPMASQVLDVVQHAWKVEREQHDGPYAFNPAVHFEHPELRHYYATHYLVPAKNQNALEYFDNLCTLAAMCHYITAHGMHEYEHKFAVLEKNCREREPLYPQVSAELTVDQVTDAQIMETW